MAALIRLKPGVDWTASGGLFDWTVEFLIPRVSDEDVAGTLRDTVEHNLGSLWIDELPVESRREIVAGLRSELLPAAERELPPGPAIDSLRELITLADQVDLT